MNFVLTSFMTERRINKNFLTVLTLSMLVNGLRYSNGERCVCLITRELRPVCGTDGITYDNKRKLLCKNKCDKTSEYNDLFKFQVTC